MMPLSAGYRACARRGVDTRRVDVLDGIRALAILIVAWFHIWQQSWLRPPYLVIAGLREPVLNFEPLVRTGYIMVDVMLLISGFLLFLPYARHRVEGARRPSVKDFYVKRALRILPSYWLCVLVMLFAFALPAHGWRLDRWLRLDLITHLTFTHVFDAHTYVGTELNVVLWTLAIEVQFYLVFPLIARAFVRRPLWIWALLAGAGLAFRGFIVGPRPDTSLWVNQLPAFLDVYANGMLAALLYVHMARSIQHNRWTRLAGTALALVAALAIWQLVLRHASPSPAAHADPYETIRISQAKYRFLLSAYACVFILASANAGAFLRYLLSNKAMRVASAISFQYYIWHQFLAAKMHNDWRFPPSLFEDQHNDPAWQWQFTLCAFLFPLILSLALTYGVEAPLARAGWRAWTRRKEKLKENRKIRIGGNPK